MIMQRGFETLKFIAKMNFAAHSTVIRTNGHGPDGLHPFAVAVIPRIFQTYRCSTGVTCLPVEQLKPGLESSWSLSPPIGELIRPMI